MVQVLQQTKLSVLRPEYEQLFANCKIRRNWLEQIHYVAGIILNNRDRYEKVAQVVNPLMPWYVVGLLHYLKTNFSLDRHLHNSDPLTNRTVNYPSGRPLQEPINGWAVGYTWEESAVDLLCGSGFDRAKKWDMPGGILWHIECYTGMEYRSGGMYSPYLWSGTNWYKKGQYENGTNYNPELVFERVGAGAVLFYMYYQSLLLQEQTPATAAAAVGAGVTTAMASTVGTLRINNPTGQGTYLKQSMAQSSALPDNQKVWVVNNTELPLLQWNTGNNHYGVTLNGTFNGVNTWYVFSQHATIEPLGQQSPGNQPGNQPATSPPVVQQTLNVLPVETPKPPTPQANSLYGGASGKLPLPGVKLIKEFEGCYLKAYPDPLTGGKPITIGWGCTRKRDGSEWRLGEVITQEEADNLLMTQLENDYLPPMEQIPGWQQLNANQQGALLSFGYNLGARFFGNPNFQSMTRVLQNKQWEQIEETFLKYRNPGSNVEQGLKRRRIAEAKLFLTPVGAQGAPPAPTPSQHLGLVQANVALTAANNNSSDTNRWVQEQLIRFCILDPPADGKWGKQSQAALSWFQQFKRLSNCTGTIDNETLAALKNTQELIPVRLGTDFASRLTQYMMQKGYYVPRGDKRYSIVYVQGVDENFQPIANTPDGWNDQRIILEIPNNGVPRIVDHWIATCDPGAAPTRNSTIAGGVAQVAFGQYQAWRCGYHYGSGSRPPYPALEQAGPINIMRDTNRNYRRDGGDTLRENSTGNFINQHHGWGSGKVGFNSMGCLVGKNPEGHFKFIDLCKQDVRYQVNSNYLFWTTVIEGTDLFKT